MKGQKETGSFRPGIRENNRLSLQKEEVPCPALRGSPGPGEGGRGPRGLPDPQETEFGFQMEGLFTMLL